MAQYLPTNCVTVHAKTKHKSGISLEFTTDFKGYCLRKYRQFWSRESINFVIIMINNPVEPHEHAETLLRRELISHEYIHNLTLAVLRQ